MSRWFLSLLLIWLPFGVMRILFVVMYPESFNQLSGFEIGQAYG